MTSTIKTSHAVLASQALSIPQSAPSNSEAGASAFRADIEVPRASLNPLAAEFAPFGQYSQLQPGSSTAVGAGSSFGAQANRIALRLQMETHKVPGPSKPDECRAQLRLLKRLHKQLGTGGGAIKDAATTAALVKLGATGRAVLQRTAARNWLDASINNMDMGQHRRQVVAPASSSRTPPPACQPHIRAAGVLFYCLHPVDHTLHVLLVNQNSRFTVPGGKRSRKTESGVQIAAREVEEETHWQLPASLVQGMISDANSEWVPGGKYQLYFAHLPGMWDLPERIYSNIQSGKVHPAAREVTAAAWASLRTISRRRLPDGRKVHRFARSLVIGVTTRLAQIEQELQAECPAGRSLQAGLQHVQLPAVGMKPQSALGSPATHTLPLPQPLQGDQIGSRITSCARRSRRRQVRVPVTRLRARVQWGSNVQAS